MAETNLISVRTSTLAIVRKGCEAPLEVPSENNQFVAIQSDLSFAPNIETTENPEIRNDIMAAQAVISGESPSVTFSHLLKGSGEEGKVPAYGPLLESTFGGLRDLKDATTKTKATSGGDKSKIVFDDANTASRYEKGDILLVRNQATDAEFELRPVKEVSGNTVELGFDLDFNIADDVAIGKTTTFFPKNAGFPVVDMWHYLEGGDAGLEWMKDGRTVTTAITANAKENINVTYTVEGLAYGLNDKDYLRIEVSATGNANRLQVIPSVGGSSRPKTAVTIPAKTYTPDELAAALQTELRKLTNGGNISVDIGSTGKIEISFGSASSDVDALAFPFQGAGNDGAEVIGAQLGFNTGSNFPVGTAHETIRLPNTPQGEYLPDGLEPEYESTPPVNARNQRLYLGSETGENICLHSPTLSFNIGTAKTTLTSICVESGNYASVINERTASMTVTTYLEQNDQRFFQRFKEGDQISFFFAGGNKSDGDWKKGECFGIYGSEATITSFSLSQVDNVYAIDMEVTCYSPGDGTGSIFLGFC